MKSNIRLKLLFLPIIAGFIILLFLINHYPDPLPQDTHADRIEVYKSKRILELWNGSKKLKTYSIMLGGHPLGPKESEGDGRTPEGRYIIDYRNSESSFHLSLHISYPDSLNIKRANELKTSAGGLIMIHGLRNGLGWLGTLLRKFDWTDGCIAVTNPEIEEIWRVVPNKTPIVILP